MRVGAYARVSVLRDGTEDSTERQLESIEKWCESMGHVVVEQWSDSGITGWKDKDRPGLRAAIEAVEGHKVEAVAIYAISRAFRNTRRLLDFVELCKVNGVAFISITQGIDTSQGGMAGVLIALLGALAEMESANKSELVLPKMRKNAEAGAATGGSRPYGYRAGGMLVDEHEAGVLREIAARALDGESVKAISLDLTSRGELGTKGGPLSVSVIRRMFENPRYAGRRVHRGKDVAAAQWPAILDRETLSSVSKVIASDRERLALERTISNLAGKVVCGKCGTVMKVKNEGRNPALFACGTKEERHASAQVDRLEAWVDEMRDDRVGRGDIVERIIVNPGRGPTPLQRRVEVHWVDGVTLRRGRPEVRDEAPARKKAERGTCSQGDGLPVHTIRSGLCRMHYIRKWRGQPLGPNTPLRKQKATSKCIVITPSGRCKEWAEHRGLCAIHYQRVQRTGDVQADKPIKHRKSPGPMPEATKQKIISTKRRARRVG